jgi:hypothetical protein
MIIVSILAMATISIAAWAGLHILNKEYLPLLKELERTRKTLETAEGQGDSGKGRIG